MFDDDDITRAPATAVPTARPSPVPRVPPTAAQTPATAALTARPSPAPRVPPTAAPTPATAARTARRSPVPKVPPTAAHSSPTRDVAVDVLTGDTALARCVACSAREFAEEHWGRAPRLSRAAELPADFTDLIDAARGRRAGVRARAADAVPAHGEGRRGAGRRRRSPGAEGPEPRSRTRRPTTRCSPRSRTARRWCSRACTGRGLRSSTSPHGSPRSSAIRCRSTRTSRRRRARASRPITTSTTCSSCRCPGASTGPSTRRSSTTRWATSPSTPSRPRSPSGSPRSR